MDDRLHVSPGSFAQSLIISEGDGRTVAVVYDRDRDNPNLFAAAPRMLAALVEAEQFLANEPNLPGDGWMCDTLREIRAAIAAAKPDA